MAYGTPARVQAAFAAKSIRKVSGLPVAIVSDRPLGDWTHVHALDADPGGRQVKLSLDTLSPFEQTLYLDADTRVKGDLTVGFSILEDGWDIALTPSSRQGADVLGNCTLPDRDATIDDWTVRDVLGLQAGVMWFAKTPSVHHLFATWREEWTRFRAMDQGALLRALRRQPVRLWLFGRAFNDGEVVQHLFGRAARTG